MDAAGGARPQLHFPLAYRMGAEETWVTVPLEAPLGPGVTPPVGDEQQGRYLPLG